MPHEELLDPGPRRAVPRWLVVLVVLLVVGAASYLLVRRNHPSPHHPAAAASTAVVPSAPAPSVPATPISGVGYPLQLPGGVAVAVAVATDASWVLTTQQLYRVSTSGTIVGAAVPSPPLPPNGASQTRLALDEPGHVVWAVLEGARHARVYAYDTSTMRLRRAIGTLGFVTGAAAMRGHLYVGVGDNLIDVGPSGAPRTIIRTRDSIGGIAADPLRDRLLVSDYGDPTRVWSMYPASARPMRGPTLIQVTKASIGVAGDGTIWLAGFDTGDGVLMKLDPVTLRPILHSPLDRSVQPGAVLAASGSAVVWVRPNGGDDLDCVDARTGQNLQSWVIFGDVASSGHHALIASVDGFAAPLQLGACPG